MRNKTEILRRSVNFRDVIKMWPFSISWLYSPPWWQDVCSQTQAALIEPAGGPGEVHSHSAPSHLHLLLKSASSSKVVPNPDCSLKSLQELFKIPDTQAYLPKSDFIGRGGTLAF